MLLLAAAALSVGYLTAPAEKKISGGIGMAGVVSGVESEALSKPAESTIQNNLPQNAAKPQPEFGAAPVLDITPGVIYTASFTDLDGKSQSLGQWQNKLLVINFWATWCAPCKEEMPIFVKIQQKFSANNLQIVGIAADSHLNIVNFAKKVPINYPLYSDESAAIDFSKRLGNRLGLLPHTVVVAPGGEIVYAKLGVVVEADFEALLRQHLPK